MPHKLSVQFSLYMIRFRLILGNTWVERDCYLGGICLQNQISLPSNPIMSCFAPLMLSRQKKHLLTCWLLANCRKNTPTNPWKCMQMARNFSVDFLAPSWLSLCRCFQPKKNAHKALCFSALLLISGPQSMEDAALYAPLKTNSCPPLKNDAFSRPFSFWGNGPFKKGLC